MKIGYTKRIKTRITNHLVPVAVFGICLLSAAFCSARSQHAIISSVSADNSKGSYSWIQEGKSGGRRLHEQNMMPTIPHVRVAAYSQYYYVLEGEGLNRITQFDIVTLDQQTWQYSAMSVGETDDTVPYDMIFANDAKAYLLRYGSNIAWIVNPLAATEAEFKIGELDLSAYDDGDGSPEMCGGVVVDGNAYILLRRIDPEGKPETAYIAVIDTATDTMVNTGKDNTLPGIPLTVKHPVYIQYLDDNGLIYVHGCGAVDPSPDYTGGIESIDPSTYTATMIVDDGDADNHAYGYITGMAIVSSEDGFFIGASSETDQLLYHFNPTSGKVNEVVYNSTDPNYLQHVQLAGLTGGMAVDQHSRLWLGDLTERRITILNTTPNNGLYTRDMNIDMESDNSGLDMFPEQIVFCWEPEETQEDEAKKQNSSGESGNFCFINTILDF